MELNPHSLWAYPGKTIFLLSPLGRFEEALECHDRALTIDPLSLAVLANLAMVLECLHRKKRKERPRPRESAGSQLCPRAMDTGSVARRRGRISEAVELADA